MSCRAVEEEKELLEEQLNHENLVADDNVLDVSYIPTLWEALFPVVAISICLSWASV